MAERTYTADEVDAMIARAVIAAQERPTHITWDERGVRTVNGVPDDAPQRPWVDLRDSQIETLYYETVKVHRGAPMPQGQVIFGRAVQDKLRELNT